jgi:hypothetical protein
MEGGNLMKLSQAKFSCPEPIKVNGKAKTFDIHVKGVFNLEPKLSYQYGQFEIPTYVGLIDETFKVVNKRQLKKIIAITLKEKAIAFTGKAYAFNDDIRFVWFITEPEIYDESVLKEMEGM